ncbi:hypothetical protein GW17_00029243 [Ensete ventricosum]|nr:hypothetical protein GW17_00029243 [Ensete ventricosum]
MTTPCCSTPRSTGARTLGSPPRASPSPPPDSSRTFAKKQGCRSRDSVGEGARGNRKKRARLKMEREREREGEMFPLALLRLPPVRIRAPE